jgi:cytochrome oxidase Cu insertion factor (SCO1/SenC/PrrC family)
MEVLDITVTPQLDGVNFSMEPRVLKILLSEFPDAKPIRKIFVSYDPRKDDIKLLFETVKKFLLPAMVGIENQDNLKKIKKLRFFSPSNRIDETIISFN